MRLLTRRIYRAFPELDRYNDEQCARFVKSARKGGLTTLLHAAAILATLLPLMGAALLGTTYLYDTLGTANISILRVPWGFEITWLLASCTLFACAMSAGLLVRDILLRRRLKFVLRTRGACPACQYSLIGLTVSDESMVQCPECGVEIEVDASLAELSTDAQNASAQEFGTTGHTRRTMTIKTQAPSWWTPKRKRTAALIALTSIALPATIWGGHEWWLARQADAAAADRAAFASRLSAILARPPAQSVSPNRLDAALSIVDFAESINATLRQSAPQSLSAPGNVNFDVLIPDTFNVRYTAQYLALRAQEAQRARAVLRLYLAGGFAAKAKALTQPGPAWAVAPSSTTASALYAETYGQLTRAATLSPILQAWAMVAAESNNEQEVLAAMEANLALCRVLALASYPGTILAVAREYPTLDRVRAMLLSHPTESSLSALAAILDRQKFDIDTAALIEGHRLASLDDIAALFESVENARFGIYSKRWAGYREMITPFRFRLGTYQENKAALNAEMDAYTKYFALSPQTRAAAPLVVSGSGLLLVDFVVSRNLEFASRQIDAIRLEHTALCTMIALEQFRISRGSYPQTLDELVPKFLETLPMDHWSRAPLRYLPIPATATRSLEPRLYTLYSVGPDTTDDGGQPTPGNLYRTGQIAPGDIVYTSPSNDPK